MSLYCCLGKTDIPPIGCRNFDLNYCKIEMKCQFIREVSEENYEQRIENIQKLEQNLDNPENESRLFFFKESYWKDWEY